MSNEPLKINLGCGNKVISGWINLDQKKHEGVNVVHDLNKFPYPFTDASVDEILMSHVLEHLQDPVSVLNELHRILKPGGKLVIKVPHYSGNDAWVDLTHKRPYAYLTLKLLENEENCGYYDLRTFSKVDARLGFWKGYYVWNYLIEPLANLKPVLYEVLFANIFTVHEIIYEVRK